MLKQVFAAVIFFGLAGGSRAATFSILSDPPSEHLLAAFNAVVQTNATSTLGSMGPARKQLGAAKGDNRMVGQRVALPHAGKLRLQAITFRVASVRSFSGGGDANTLLLHVVDASGISVGDFSYDLSGAAFAKGDYLRLDLEGLSVPTGTDGTVLEFQLYFGETDSENALALERDNGGNSYAEGMLISRASAQETLVLPVAAPSGGSSDLTFFLQGEVVPPDSETLGLLSAFCLAFLMLRGRRAG